ncbi:InaD-like protein [Eumeta japonica]|uniref:InaD-like protein n=1 Tax=Eumeta variegata TaxID=151549 RepID=A0A4C1YLR2_EUMVA|nr:InaD-like protein [Eumeta japonica]
MGSRYHSKCNSCSKAFANSLATRDKIRKKYAALGESVVAVRLERSARAGLGLSLAGHRDRSRMAVFVCGLNPAGAAARAAPAIKVGDEILEIVNSDSGRSPLERIGREICAGAHRINHPAPGAAPSPGDAK